MHIKVDFKIFFFLLLFYFTNQIQMYSLLMLLAIIHEVGHLLMGILLGMKIQKIELMPMGVCVSFQTRLEDYNKKIGCTNRVNLKKLAIALAGPSVNILLGILFWFMPISIGNIDSSYFVYANLLIAIFNLLPIYPLDGGRIAKCLFKMKWNLETTLNYTNLISNITMIALTMVVSIVIYCYHNIALLLILGYLWFLAIQENKKYFTRKRIYQTIKKYSKIS